MGEGAESLRSQVIIIGGGLSGLSCAKWLTDAGISVKVLEATGRVGGRTYTKRDPDSIYKYVDLGGSYIGPSQFNVQRLAHELGVKTYKIQCEGDYYFFRKKVNQQFNGTWPESWNPFVWLDINNLFRKMDQLLQEVPLSNPWQCKHLEEWDKKTAHEFFKETCWTNQGLEFAQSFVNTTYAVEPWEISLIWFLWMTHGTDSSRMSWEVDGGAQDSKFLEGSMSLSEKIAGRLGASVILNQPVQRIVQDKSGVSVETIDGNIYLADFAVVAMPPTLQSRLLFDPPLPAMKMQLLQRVPMGSTLKNQTWYKRPFWKDKGMCGFGSCSDLDEIISNSVDDFRPDCPYHSLVGFIEAGQARRVCHMTPDERKQATCDFYRRVFDSDEAMQPLAYEEFNWCEAPFYGGCYVGTFPPGVMRTFAKHIRTPHHQVFFAGTETATRWMGYMDGAIDAGERAAREVLCALGRIKPEKVWINPHLPSEEEQREVSTIRLTWFERHAPSVGQAAFVLYLVGLAGVLALGSRITHKSHVMSNMANRLGVWTGQLTDMLAGPRH